MYLKENVPFKIGEYVMLKITTISFPGLGIGEFQVNSEAFSVFGISIAWYAIIITMGMIFAVGYTIYRSKQIGIAYEEILDFAIFVIPFGVIGARLYYVLTTLENYSNLWEMLDIRSGGLAIYGGIIAGALTVFVVCHVKKIYFPAFGDGVVPGVIMAQAIGRWGNFMNGEAYGYETDIFCRMGLGAGSSVVYYHPTFLYESLWNIVGFILINIFFKHKKYDGQIILLVFGWYGLGRAWIEGLRTDSLYIPGTSLRISQVLAIAIFLACLAMLIYFAIKPPKRELYVKKAPISESEDK